MLSDGLGVLSDRMAFDIIFIAGLSVFSVRRAFDVVFVAELGIAGDWWTAEMTVKIVQVSKSLGSGRRIVIPYVRR